MAAILLLPAVIPMVGITAAAYDSVTVVPSGFTGITNATQLNNVRNNLSGKYILMANITLTGNWTPIGANYSAPFTGVFDGNGYKISGMNVSVNATTGSTAYAGLFGVVLDGEVKNLSVAGSVNASIAGMGNVFAYAGGIVGSLENGKAINCYNWVNVTANSTAAQSYIYAGGIAGENYDGTLELCYNNAKISASAKHSAYAGGITASNYGDLRQSFNLQGVIANANDVAASAGGITGYSTFDHLADCFNTGAVIATVGATSQAQPQSLSAQSLNDAPPFITARRPGEPVTLTTQADVNTTNVAAAGGVVGFSNSGTLGTSYNAARVNANALYSYAGGVFGINSGSSANTYFASEQASLGSGYVYNSALNQTKGLLESAMKNMSSFSGFNTSTVWTVRTAEQYGFPQLRKLLLSALSLIPTKPGAMAVYNGHTYKLYTTPMASWEAAKAYCESVGGHLATITSAGENTFVYNYIKSNGSLNAYFGLTNTSGKWKWVTNEAVSYTNWAPGEPNNEFGNEHYGMYYWKYLDGKWNDGDYGGITDKGEVNFICEWDKVLTVEPKPVETIPDPAVLKNKWIWFWSTVKKEAIHVSIDFSDSLFNNNASVYNHNLALAGMALSAAAYDKDYVKEALTKELKFGSGAEANFLQRNYGVANDSGSDLVAYSIGVKQITCNNKRYNLIAVIVRGTIGDEWYSNFNMGKTQKHAGFSAAAERVYTALKNYVDTNVKNGLPNKIFVTGHVLVLKPEMLLDEYKTPECQLFLPSHGNGCRPHASGRSIFGEFLVDGDKSRFWRQDFLGVLKLCF